VPGRGTWRFGKDQQYKINFVSHHAYQAVPYWGHWGKHPKTNAWSYLNHNQHPKPRGEKYKYNFGFPNETEPEYLAANRWLWDSLCMRLRTWSKANKDVLRLITEYGCYERDNPKENMYRYGKRVPAFTHFACWAGLVLGHAGVPLKWNDGAEHGEMAPRTSFGEKSAVWNSTKYPIDNYQELKNIAVFLYKYKINLHSFLPQEFKVLAGLKHDKHFNAWALANNRAGANGNKSAQVIAWVYDRTFSTNGRKPNRTLQIQQLDPKLSYRIDWFDTWAGRPLRWSAAGKSAGLQPDSTGKLAVSLPAFPKTKRKNIAGDGNDIALYLSGS
jgi:hypothetical protein